MKFQMNLKSCYVFGRKLQANLGAYFDGSSADWVILEDAFCWITKITFIDKYLAMNHFHSFLLKNYQSEIPSFYYKRITKSGCNILKKQILVCKYH